MIHRHLQSPSLFPFAQSGSRQHADARSQEQDTPGRRQQVERIDPHGIGIHQERIAGHSDNAGFLLQYGETDTQHKSDRNAASRNQHPSQANTRLNSRGVPPIASSISRSFSLSAASITTDPTKLSAAISTTNIRSR